MSERLPTLRIRLRSSLRVLEIQLFRDLSPGEGALEVPSGPDLWRRDAAERPPLLRIGPRRWLAPEPTRELLAASSAMVDSGAGVLTEVGGKWQVIEVAGREVGRRFARTTWLESVLHGRDCAVLPLFDCPTIVMRHLEGFEVWVERSYAEDFLMSLKRHEPSRPVPA